MFKGYIWKKEQELNLLKDGSPVAVNATVEYHLHIFYESLQAVCNIYIDDLDLEYKIELSLAIEENEYKVVAFRGIPSLPEELTTKLTKLGIK